MHGIDGRPAPGMNEWRDWRRSPDGAALWAIGLWFRAVVAGAMLGAAGLATLFTDPGLPAAAMLAGGTAVTVLAARRLARRLAGTGGDAAAAPAAAGRERRGAAEPARA